MSQRYLAVERTADGLCWALARAKRKSRPQLLEAGCLLSADETELAEQVQQQLFPRLHRDDQVLAALSPRACFQRELTFPFGDSRKVRSALELELSRQLPAPLKGYRFAALPAERLGDERFSVFTACADPEVIDAQVQPLAALGLNVAAVEPAPRCYAAGLPEGYEQCFLLHADRNCSSVCLLDQGRVVQHRLIGGADNASAKSLGIAITRTVAMLQRETNSPPRPALLFGDLATSALISVMERLNLKAEIFSNLSPANGDLPTPATPVALLALGVAGSSGSRSLRLPVQTGRGETAPSPWLPWLAPAALLGATLLALAIGAGWQHRLLAQQAERLKTEMAQTFRRALPETHTIVNIPVQMRTALKALDQRAQLLAPGNRGPLEQLADISSRVPPDMAVTLEEFSTEGDTVRLLGKAPSFDVLNQMKSQLEKSPLFGSVQIQEAQRTAEAGQIHFRLQLLPATAKGGA